MDASLDLSIFGKQIAPQLSIRKRFVGEEPFDKFTKQYNESMKKQLPGYGIEVEEIKRKEFHGKPISASLVRKLYHDGLWGDLKQLLPDTTYRYLMQRKQVYENNSNVFTTIS